MVIVKNFHSLINLLDNAEAELAKLADELIYMMHLHEDEIKARQNMRFGRLFGK